MKSFIFLFWISTILWAKEPLEAGQRVLIEFEKDDFIDVVGLVTKVNSDGKYTVSFENRDGEIVTRKYKRKRLHAIVQEHNQITYDAVLNISQKGKLARLGKEGRVRAITEDGYVLASFLGKQERHFEKVLGENQYTLKEKGEPVVPINPNNSGGFSAGTRVFVNRPKPNRPDVRKSSNQPQIAYVVGRLPDGQIVVDFPGAPISIKKRTFPEDKIIKIVNKKNGFREGDEIETSQLQDSRGIQGKGKILAVGEDGSLSVEWPGKQGTSFTRYLSPEKIKPKESSGDCKSPLHRLAEDVKSRH